MCATAPFLLSSMRRASASGVALGLQCSDVQLMQDDEKIRVFGKGQRERTVMLTAAPESIRLLRRHLKQNHLTSGSVFRGDPRYGEVLSRWTTAWPTTPGRNIVRKPRSRPRFTNCA